MQKSEDIDDSFDGEVIHRGKEDYEHEKIAIRIVWGQKDAQYAAWMDPSCNEGRDINRKM